MAHSPNDTEATSTSTAFRAELPDSNILPKPSSSAPFKQARKGTGSNVPSTTALPTHHTTLARDGVLHLAGPFHRGCSENVGIYNGRAPFSRQPGLGCPVRREADDSSLFLPERTLGLAAVPVFDTSPGCSISASIV